MDIMKLVDAHIHLSDAEYSGCVDGVVEESKRAGIGAMVSNSVDLATSKGCLELCEKYHGLVFAALGIHPWNVQTLTDEEFEQTLKLIEANRQNTALVAIGEIGLDFKYMNVWDKQLAVFNKMLRLAEKLGLPVVVHSRGKTAEMIDMLPSYNLNRVLLHWFSNPISALSKAVEKGYLISEGPPVVYSNGIRKVVRKVPLTSLLTETDGPVRYFRKPFEGKRTTPAFTRIVVETVAELKRMKSEDVAEQIMNNFHRFFG